MSEELDRLRQEMTQQFSAMRSDIKELSSAMLELVRLDGKLNTMSELLYRVAKQVDDLESRVRVLENNAGISTQRVTNNERMVWIVITGLLGIAFAAMQAGVI